MKKVFKNKKILLLFICLFFMLVTGVSAAVIIFSSDEVSYDNTNSTLSATDVQAAIDELFGKASSCTNISPAMIAANPILGTYINLGAPSIVTSGKDLLDLYIKEQMME